MNDETSRTVALGWHDDKRMAEDYKLVDENLKMEKPYDIKTAYTNEFLDQSDEDAADQSAQAVLIEIEIEFESAEADLSYTHDCFRQRPLPVRKRSHEYEIPGVQRGVVRERNRLVVAIEAGMDLPLVGTADLADGRALRLGAEAAEHQEIPSSLVAVEVGDGRAVGAAGEEHEGVVAVAANQGVRARSQLPVVHVQRLELGADGPPNRAPSRRLF